MWKTITLLVRTYSFWILFFLIERIVFVVYFHADIFPVSFLEFLKIFIFGIRMDASMGGYICALPFLLFCLKWFIPSLRIPAIIYKIYLVCILSICALLTIVNLNIYREWGTKLPYRVLTTFFNNPTEAVASSSSSPLLLSGFLLFILIVSGVWLAKKMIPMQLPYPFVPWYRKLIICSSLLIVLFLFIRSGWQTTALNPSMAYFSTKPILNHAAVNTEWNLMSTMLHSKNTTKNPYGVMHRQKAQQLIKPYLNSAFEPVHLLTEKRPNVVLIILESFTADLIESLGGEKGIAPNMEKLISEGVLFTNIYAAGDRTDKGIVAIMSGFPSQATKSIIKNITKMEKLPGIGQEFLQQGYKTSFFYGGESEFYNFKSFMLSHGIQKVIDQYDFPLKDVRSKWGAFDHLTFSKQLTFLTKASQPFFSVLMTLSNHEPFDLPGTPKFGSNTMGNSFRSTAFYTDSTVFDYLQKAKAHDWYKNTLFVLIADHGHRLPLERWESYHPNRYRIPFLFFGEVIKKEFRGTKIDKIGNQTDMATTLLHQLGISADAYVWSKDLLDPQTPPFGFFDWDDGFGVVSPEQTLTFDNIGKNIIYEKNVNASDSLNEVLKQKGQAYLQEVYQQYLSY